MGGEEAVLVPSNVRRVALEITHILFKIAILPFDNRLQAVQRGLAL